MHVEVAEVKFGSKLILRNNRYVFIQIDMQHCYFVATFGLS